MAWESIIPQGLGRYIIIFQAIGVLLIGLYFLKGYDIALQVFVLILAILIWLKIDVIIKSASNLVSTILGRKTRK